MPTASMPSPPRALRVAVVTETYPPEVNGVAMTIARMVEGLRARGHTVQLVRPRQGRGEVPVCAQRFEEVLVTGAPIPNYPDLRMGLASRHRLVRAWMDFKPDVVQIVTEGPLGLTAARAARALGVPAASEFHTNFHNYGRHYRLGWLRPATVAYLRWFHRQSARVMVPTEVLARQFHDQGNDNARVVARGADLELFSPRRRSRELRGRWGVGDGDTVALYVGRIAGEKNLPLVMRAYAAMRAVNPALRLVLVGDGPQREALARVHPNAVFAGTRRGEDLAEHYASADLFLFPSLTETYGNVTVEALASGLAVVAFDTAAAAQLITHGENGLLAPPPAAFGENKMGDAPGAGPQVSAGPERGAGDLEFIRQAVRLAAEPETVARLRSRARAAVEHLSWGAVFEALEAVLTETAALSGSHDAKTQLSLKPD